MGGGGTVANRRQGNIVGGRGDDIPVNVGSCKRKRLGDLGGL